MLVPKYPFFLYLAIAFIVIYLIIALILINKHQRISPFVKRYKWQSEQKRKNSQELKNQLDKLKDNLKNKQLQ
jgi:large-conductance mechanosensitive channel